jgi:hypothetical protein
VKHVAHSVSRPRAILRRALPAALALLPLAAALAADERRSPLPDASAPFGPAGWLLLVALGLIAVAAGAFTFRRPNRARLHEPAANDSRLGPATAVPPAEAPGSVAPAPADGDVPAPRPGSAGGHNTLVERAFAGPDGHAAPIEPAIAAEAQTAAALVATPVAPMPGAATPGGADSANGFLALHHVDLSIDVLHRHVEREPRPMPAVWVMLLDLCRTHGREQKFRELALEFHKRFNVRAPSWERYPPGREEAGLEAYPRLVRSITAAWGTHECNRLLERLLCDNRGGSRRGFTLNAYNDLIALRRAAQSVIETIDADLALEAARPAPTSPVAVPGAASANDACASPSPMLRELTDQLDADLAPAATPTTAPEPGHPASADVLVREWGNAALAGRLCEMLARGSDGAPPLTPEAAEELALLKRLAERLDPRQGLSAAAGD